MNYQSNSPNGEGRQNACGTDLQPPEDDHVGPVDGGRCYHGDVSIELDPDPAYLATCSEPSTFAVPSPEGTRASGPLRFCEYHLARYLEAVRDDVEAELVARGARHYAADPAFVRIGDAPDELPEAGSSWLRYALDQRGRAHYLEAGGDDVLVLLPNFNYAIKRLDGGHATHFEAVRARVGLAAFDDRADHPLADDDRELVADGGRDVFREHYRENGNRDPRGNGQATGGGHHGGEFDRECPFCGEDVANKLYLHLPCDGSSQLVADGGLDVQETTPTERELLFAVARIEQLDTPRPTAQEVADHLADRGVDVRYGYATHTLGDLEAVGWVESDQRETAIGRNPRTWALSAEGDRALEAHVERRLEQLGAGPIESWTTVVEREARNPDRVVDDAFCSRCGSVWAGEGVCPECDGRFEEELLADGGHRLPDLDLPGFGDDPELVPDGGRPREPAPPRPETFRCWNCGELRRGIPWAVGGGSPAGELLDLDPVQLVDVCDECMAAVADELETTEERAIADGGLDLDDPVLVEREVLRELVDVAKGKLEGDTAHGSPGYDVDAFAKTIAHGERALRGGGST